jgi:phosphomannomutase
MKVDPSIFKGYDIRGIYPTSLNEKIAYAIGQAYVTYVKPQKEVLVSRDVRIHSEDLANSLIEGITDSGVDVVDSGLMSTDMLYFGVGNYKLGGGVQATASHSPAEWHGFKMVEAGPVAMAYETGIGQIKDLVLKGEFKKSEKKGSIRKLDIWDDYCKYILGWVDPKKVKPLKIVIDANFGLAAQVFRRIIELGNLPIEIVPLNAEPDGTFPKGRPDPFVPENRDEFTKLVIDSGANLGIAWDADADRVFFCAEDGTFIEPYYLNTVLIKSMLKKNPGEKVIYDPRYIWALIEAIRESGGEPVLCRVGHSYIKEKMRSENALFATESSGHTYYRDYWYADCGMIPPMQVIEYLSEHDAKLSELVKDVMSKYFVSGEINTPVADVKKVIEEIKKKYADATQSELDGISIEYHDFRFTVRPSNTEPLLRLTLEARSKELMEQKRDEVLAIIRS